MLDEMSSQQIAEWQAFFSLEPWGFDVENVRHGAACATAIAPHTRRKPDPQSFMLKTAADRLKDPPDWREMQRRLLEVFDNG